MKAGLRPALLLLLLAACVDVNTPGTQVVTWQGTLVPVLSHPDLAGQVAAAAQGASGTDVGIGISGAGPGAVHAWGVGSGTCAAPGALLGASTDYPLLAADDSGKAAAQTHLITRLSADSAYHGELWQSATDTTRIACGNLEKR
jgi:hypothetical protein